MIPAPDNAAGAGLTTAQRIGRRIAERGLNVGEAAALLGLTRPSLSKVLNGRAELSIRLALQIEKKVGLVARDLLIQQLDEQMAAARRPTKRK